MYNVRKVPTKSNAIIGKKEETTQTTEITFLKFNHNNDICRDCNNDVIMEEKDFIEEFTV